MESALIDLGSDIVFAVAGACSLGAMSAVNTRGVWGVAALDRSSLGSLSHILALEVRRIDQAVFSAIRSFVQGTLPGGSTITLGLDDNAVGIEEISLDVPKSVRKQLEREKIALIRRSR